MTRHDVDSRPTYLASALAGVLLVACAGDPATVDPDPAAPPDLIAAASMGEGAGEVWVAAQDRSEIHILHGFGATETIPLPPGTGPHEIDFSPSGRYAYVANVGDGSLRIIRASDRTEVASFALGGIAGAGDVGTHQARPSPDGTIVLVSQIPSRTLIKLAVDEDAEDWQIVGGLTLEHSPVCTAFSGDGARAYVSLGPPRNGIVVIDVATMTVVTAAGDDGILETEGNVQCGLVNSKDGRRIFVDSWGAGQAVGHFYVLDTSTDVLTPVTSFPAFDLHGFAMSPNERFAFAAERGGDALRRIDLSDPSATPLSIPLDPRPGLPDRPDKIATRGAKVYATLRAEGSVAVVNGMRGTVRTLRLVPASPNALHGVAIRP